MHPPVGTDRDLALQAVLDRLTGPAAEVPDRPDAWITAVRRLPACEARYAPFPDGVDDRLRAALRARGVDRLYAHQVDAIAHALAGRHVVVTTPTASGKTLCYTVPILSRVLRDPSARALCLFPTKALAQDQLAGLRELSTALEAHAEIGVGVSTYDGDTPQDARRSIRTRAQIVLTNPDMLHTGVLPHHPRWARLFENLRFVVIDELHAYRGVFGSHLANVLRRMRRICRHYGSDPTFICSSATIANPCELAESLVEQPFALVSESGAPRGEKFFLFVNPPVVNRELGLRRSYLAETRRVAGAFLGGEARRGIGEARRHGGTDAQGLSLELAESNGSGGIENARDIDDALVTRHRAPLALIVFAQTRLATELLTTYLKEDVEWRPGAEDAVRGYRGGYLPERRRAIEQGLREGRVRVVVSTNALELGIDIGALDVCVMAGYPGTIAATWQRAGRAGRRSSRSAAVLVASSAPLDQFIIRNPSFFFEAPPERALVNADNLHILVDHVKCAAFELPFTTAEEYGRQPVQEVLAVLEESGLVHRVTGEGGEGYWQWTSESYPANAVSLRSISSDNFVVIDTTRGADVIGETSFTSGPSTLHEKAIYMVEGALHQVERLDFDNRKAYVRQVDCDYYTDAITYTKVAVVETFAESGADPHRPETAAVAAHGDVQVTSRVVGFKKIKFHTNENIGSGDLQLPEQQMRTTAYWLTLPRAVMTAIPLAADDRRDGVVGLAYAMRLVAQLLLMCDRHDIGVSIGNREEGVVDPVPTRTGVPAILPDEPRIFIYDNYPGGIGFSEPLFTLHGELLARTRDLIAGCPCDLGCPGCVGPIGETGPMGKVAALHLLDGLAGHLRPAVHTTNGTGQIGSTTHDFRGLHA